MRSSVRDLWDSRILVIVVVVFIIVVYLVIVIFIAVVLISTTMNDLFLTGYISVVAVKLGTIVGGHDGAMFCHPGSSRRYHYCIIVVNFVVSIILCHCHATTNHLPMQFCCIQPLVLPYRNYCNHVPSLLIQNNCCIIHLRPVRLLDDVELYHISFVGISLVLAISLVLVDYGV
jgi:hypothetical protein